MHRLKIIDLFCGVGGLSLGFQKAKFDVVLALDNWQRAVEIYEINFKHPVICCDLSDLSGTLNLLGEYDFDGIVGGPPCQDFSHAGKRQEGQRADLTHSFSQIVSIKKPPFFVMENVERTRTSNTYLNARNIFKNAGYGITEVVLDASLCGVPQKRKRFFCIGMLGQLDGFLLDIIGHSLSKNPMTMRQYFKDSLETEFYYRHPRNYSRRAVYSLDEPSATIRGVNRPIPPNYPGHNLDAAGVSFARPLSTLERAQVQTFPKSFKWQGSKTDVEQMIGNAVPVNLAKFVGSCINKFIVENSPNLACKG